VDRHKDVVDLAKYSAAPVINGMSEFNHPTQELGDLMTMIENLPAGKKIEDCKLAFIGDATQVCVSLMFIASKMGMDFVGLAPKELFPSKELVDEMKEVAKTTGATITLTENIDDVKGADVIYTDVWVSMGEEDQFAERIKLLEPYRVNAEMMAKTGNPDCIFLHCLPSFHDLETVVGRDIHEKFGLTEMEVSDEVFRSPASKVFDEAENRMHTIKAVMVATIGRQ
ncbi:MAG: ornithine carbamoyltransferase, partial [Clostridium sp.]|nr:ornithine carbamoyltransferase [Clostridium sp.]